MSNKLNLDVSKRVDVVARKGDTMSMKLEVKDSDGDALDLSSYSFKFEVRKTDTSNTAYADSDDTIIISTEDDSSGTKYVSVTKDSNGNVTFTAAASVMAATSSGMYVYDVQSTTSAGVVQTWLFGLFTINEDITV
jgi:hypothetical protein